MSPEKSILLAPSRISALPSYVTSLRPAGVLPLSSSAAALAPLPAAAAVASAADAATTTMITVATTTPVISARLVVTATVCYVLLQLLICTPQVAS